MLEMDIGTFGLGALAIVGLAVVLAMRSAFSQGKSEGSRKGFAAGRNRGRREGYTYGKQVGSRKGYGAAKRKYKGR